MTHRVIVGDPDKLSPCFASSYPNPASLVRNSSTGPVVAAA